MAKVFGITMQPNYDELAKDVDDPVLLEMLQQELKEKEEERNTNAEYIEEIQTVKITDEVYEVLGNISDGYDTDTQEKTSVEQTQPQEETQKIVLKRPYNPKDRFSKKNGLRVFKGGFGKGNLFLLGYLPLGKEVPRKIEIELIDEIGSW